MGNLCEKVVLYLGDPQLVRRVQETLGVREITVESSQDVAGQSDSDEADGESYTADSTSNALLARDDSSDKGLPREGSKTSENSIPPSEKSSDFSKSSSKSSSWFGRPKTRVRRRIPTPPPQSPSESSASNSTISSKVIVVETFPFLDIYFRLATELGYEPFYITFLPFCVWNVDTLISRRVVLMWFFSMYVGQALKQIFKIRRPASPPAIRLEQNPTLETEYGFPSTHATVGTTIPFCLLYSITGRYEVSFILTSLIAVTWSVSVLLSRIYLGVHSVLDIVAGSLISLVIFPLVVLGTNLVEYYMFNFWYTPFLIILLVIFMLYIYPVDPNKWSKDRGDTGAILGSAGGVLLGCCAVGQFPDDIETGPFPVFLPSIQVMSLCIVRFIIGLLLLLPTRFVMKLLCFKLLPAIMPTHGVEEVVKRPLVELPYKLITYGAIGFNAVYLCALVFEICGVSRWEMSLIY